MGCSEWIPGQGIGDRKNNREMFAVYTSDCPPSTTRSEWYWHGPSFHLQQTKTTNKDMITLPPRQGTGCFTRGKLGKIALGETLLVRKATRIAGLEKSRPDCQGKVNFVLGEVKIEV